MGLFKRRETKPPYWYLSLEECKQKLSQIERKKRELEHRLEILSKAKPAHTVLVTEDTVFAPTTKIESEIGLIMSELRLLDSEEELVKLEKDRKERIMKEHDKLKKQRKAAFVQIDVKPTGIGKDLCGEVILSRAEVSHGIEKPIQYMRDGRWAKIVVKIPPRVKDETRIKLKGAGSKAKPPGDLILIIRIGHKKEGEGA